MKKEHTGYALVERMQKGMLFFQDTKRKRTYRMNKKSEKNLPLYGIGPVIVLVVTEEKWLRDLYGKQYEDYCNRVNRCIPWFRNKVL